MNRICTIIALNYLPQAMALLDSTRKIYPEIEFFVLITDAETREQTSLNGATVLLPEDLEIPADWLKDMRVYYDAVELATSLKPFLLKTLLTENISSVTFLDPDILLFSELSEGFAAASRFGIALVPHRLTPSNIGKSNYSELAFLRYGIFNLGYISVGQGGKTMLNWWGERTRWYCTRFPNDVVFTDQKWMNFVPALFDFQVIRNPGYDFAPWNIDERPLKVLESKFYAGENPLVFIHFSQMSGLLAKGEKTDLWGKALDDSQVSRNSLTLITDLTNDYSSQLVGYRHSILNNQESQVKVRPTQLLSYHQRQNMIQESIRSSRDATGTLSQSALSNSQFKPLGRIALIIERSATLNGARSGFGQDIPKIVQRLRNFFHK